jgi:hypothetical protein
MGGAHMAREKQAENSGQIVEVTRSEDGSVPGGDIAAAWLDEFSENLTWAGQTRWLGDIARSPDKDPLTWADLTRWLGESG